MWTCVNCGRVFKKTKQPHSCQKIPLGQHFKNKEKEKELFNFLLKTINKKVGKCRVISLPCCIHLFGSYDFLAVLPKKERLEIVFVLRKKLNSPRLKKTLPVSASAIENCIDIATAKEVDKELIKWLSEAYHLRDRVVRLASN